MNVKEILKKYLRDNGFTGLCGDDCGCEINDLMPCEMIDSCRDCVPGYRHSCKGCEQKNGAEGCELHGEGARFCIREDK